MSHRRTAILLLLTAFALPCLHAQSLGTDSLAAPDSISYPRRYDTGNFFPQLVFTSVVEKDAVTEPVRFSALSFDIYSNHDRSKHFGWYIGMGFRHLGYIRKLDDGLLMKFRTWNVSVPIGVKLGNMERGLVFGGYRIEWPFHYRERTYLEDGRILSLAEWASKRTTPFNHVVELGYQFPGGFALKAEYHLNSFHRRSFEERADGVKVRPYDAWDVHMVGLSVLFGPFKEKEEDEEEGRPFPIMPPIEI